MIRGCSIVIVWVAAAAAVYWTSIVPLECNLVEGRIQHRTLLAASAQNEADAAITARENLRKLQSCLDRCPTVATFMVAAANQRLLRRPAEAVRLYEEAMQYDRRPELYLNLGESQIECGMRDEGIRNLVTACILNSDLIDDISLYHNDVLDRVNAYRARMDSLRRALH